MSRKAFLSGVPVLLNFCASENFKDVKKIFWIEMQDIKSGKNYSMDYESNIKIANLISDFFGYELIKGKRYIFDQDNNKNNFDYIDDLPIEEGDIVSENVSMYNTSKFNGLKVELFPEGAGTYNQLYNLKRCFLTLPMTSYLRNLYIKAKSKPGLVFSKKWLIPDYLNLSSKVIKHMSEYNILSYKNLRKNYKLFFKFIDAKYQIEDIFSKNKVYIHPISPVYPLKEYSSWIKDIKKNIYPNSFILKRHPADVREFHNIFDGIPLLNQTLSAVPLEVFLHRKMFFM